MDRFIRIDTLPKGPFKDDELMELCYRDALDHIEDAMNMRQSIVVECDKQLYVPLYRALRARRKRASKEGELIEGGNPGNRDFSKAIPSGHDSEGDRHLERNIRWLFSILEGVLRRVDLSDKVIVLQHLDLMSLGADNILDRMARDMSYLLHLNPKAVFVAFKDSEIPIPDSIRRFFSMDVSIFGTPREYLPRIIAKHEALRFGSDEVDIYKLYKHFSGLNALRIRQLLDRMSQFSVYPAGEEEVKQELRRRTLAASYVELPDVTFADVGGCPEVKEELEREILRFTDRLLKTHSMEETRDIESLIPRNILFEGPPGTGKTLLAKALANHLDAAVIVVSGPEFFDQYVGESERKLREIFSRARKSAPCVIIFDEIDSIGRRRSEGEGRRSHDAVVNQLLTEMGGFRSDELVFVIGTTNHASVLDPALLSRIHKIFHIPYPSWSGRYEILNIFNKRNALGLSDEQLNFLVEKTEAWIDPNTWRKFGGRELEALCSAIRRETYGLDGATISLERLGALVEDQIEVYLPKTTFDDIGGYEQVKRQLDEDLLSMIRLAKQYRNDPEMLRTIEESIPRGVIFEGPPGTGKTLFAMAVANAIGASISVVNGPELKSKWYGQSEQNIRTLFEQARRNSPSVIVFDEMDSMMRSRDSELPGGSGSRTDNNLVNQLLTEMDGLKSKDMVYVIGTTNLASAIDTAFKRPSRFARIIHIPYPNEEARRKIIEVYDKKYRLGLTGQHYEIILEETENWIDPNRYIRFSGDHLCAICQSIQRFQIKSGNKMPIGEEPLRNIVRDMIQVPFIQVSFDDIGGYEQVKRQLDEDLLSMIRLARQYRNDPEMLRTIEESIPRGVIFEGPPGTGKTLFAMAVANAIGASISVVNGPELKNKWYGESERNIRTLFDQARRNSPSVIVFDEMDSMMRSRDSELPGGSGSRTDNNLVNQLLTEMDGLRTKDMVYVIGTTNLASAIDTAFKRPSRFSRIIHIPYPDEEARRRIIEVYDKKYRLGLTGQHYEIILEETENWIDPNKYIRFSGDHLRAICQSIQRFQIKSGNKIAIGEQPLQNIVRDMIQVPFVPVSFDEIGGYEDVKATLHEEILDMLLLARDRKDRFDEVFEIRHSIPKGVVFYGPPGTGKTLFARALATALRASIRVVNGPEIKSMWTGETERHVREIFDQARRNAPAVIVFDEFDSLAGDRSRVGSGERSVVNQLLTEMDGLKENELVFVVATTNHPDILDEAMKRPGRFEFQIEIPYPDEMARRSIFEIYNKKYRLELSKEDIDYLVFRTEMLVDITSGRRFSGDHIEAVCRTLLREKYRDSGLTMNRKLLDAAVRGRTNQPELLTDEERFVIAVHEAGHAIVGKYHPKGIPPKRISIVSELAGSLGYVWHGEPENKFVRTCEDLKGQICQLMGGRAAELLIRKEQSTGSANDLKAATRIATAMVHSLGMDEKLGPRCIPEPKQAARGYGVVMTQAMCHPDLLKLADDGIQRIIMECQENADSLLREHFDELDSLIKRLLVEETIDFL